MVCMLWKTLSCHRACREETLRIPVLLQYKTFTEVTATYTLTPILQRALLQNRSSDTTFPVASIHTPSP